MDVWIRPMNPVSLTLIHHRQNPLHSNLNSFVSPSVLDVDTSISISVCVITGPSSRPPVSPVTPLMEIPRSDHYNGDTATQMQTGFTAPREDGDRGEWFGCFLFSQQPAGEEADDKCHMTSPRATALRDYTAFYRLLLALPFCVLCCHA
jgi:hypothetical protein